MRCVSGFDVIYHAIAQGTTSRRRAGLVEMRLDGQKPIKVLLRIGDLVSQKACDLAIGVDLAKRIAVLSDMVS